MEKIDWDLVRTEYITSKLGYRVLAEKYGLSRSTLARRAQEEDWTGERKKYRALVVKKACQKSATIESTLLAKELMLASQITEQVERALADAEQFQRHLIQTKTKRGFNEDWDVEERIFDKYDMQALKTAAETLRIVEDIKRKCTGALTPAEKVRAEHEEEKIALAADRLELDKARAAISIDDGDTVGGVIKMPEQMNEADEEREPVIEDLSQEIIEGIEEQESDAYD